MIENYLKGNFDLHVVVKNKVTDKVIMRSHYADCHTTVSPSTGYTEIRVKGRIYLVYERLTHDHEVRFNPDNQTLFITFFS